MEQDCRDSRWPVKGIWISPLFWIIFPAFACLQAWIELIGRKKGNPFWLDRMRPAIQPGFLWLFEEERTCASNSLLTLCLQKERNDLHCLVTFHYIKKLWNSKILKGRDPQKRIIPIGVILALNDPKFSHLNNLCSEVNEIIIII